MNIFIEYYRNNPAIRKILDKIDAQEIVVNDAVCAERNFGAKNKQELADIVADMENLTVLTIFLQISKLAVDFAEQHCLFHKLKLPDAQIAATTLFHDAGLFTLNKKTLCIFRI
ncbi:MAG: PIN domain-containing protein [Prevotellaceae bacterium]|nr:PIN domain-containing protein [Prevotellaceae bacterium]